jgi:hypothetical protein
MIDKFMRYLLCVFLFNIVCAGEAAPEPAPEPPPVQQPEDAGQPGVEGEPGSGAVESPKPQKDLIDELYELSGKMNDLQDRLRDDRTDRVVVEGKEIDDKLSIIIEEIEKTSKQQSSSPLEKEKRQRQDQARIAQGSMPKHNLGPHHEPGKVYRSSAASIPQEKDSSWYKLPDKPKDEVIQTWGTEMPLRWKSRIAAYFISIASEDEKTPPKK